MDEHGALPLKLSTVRWNRLQQLLDDDRLAPLESSVPTERLPDLDWRSIDTFSQPASIASALPPKLDDRSPIRLIRTPEFAEPSLLQTELAAFAAWVDHAPEIRLKPLRFACSDMREILIQGEPVPSIPGQRFVVSANAIACPAGLTWDPPAPAASLIKLFGLNPGDLAILRHDGGSDIIPNANFVPVTRAAVRLTLIESNDRPLSVTEPGNSSSKALGRS